MCDCRDWVLFLATKKRDPLIESLRDRGYRITRNLDIRSHDGILERRVVYWPEPSEQGSEIRTVEAEQAEAIRRALNYAYDAGGWAVCANEVLWLTDQLRLKKELDHLWYQGRTSKISLIGESQRPFYVPRAMLSQAAHLFLFSTNDNDDLKRLGDIGGRNVEIIRATVTELRQYEFLYVGTRTGVLLRSKVEINPRG